MVWMAIRPLHAKNMDILYHNFERRKAPMESEVDKSLICQHYTI